MAPYRVIVADRHRSFREALRRILDDQPDLEIMGEAGEGMSLLQLVRNSPAGPLLVILDVSLPNVPWMEAIRKVKADHGETDVLILSMHEDVEYLEMALESGAEGYLAKERVDRELLQAVEMIREGGVYTPQSLADKEGPSTEEDNGLFLSSRLRRIHTRLYCEHLS
jgi:two-component system, NarL family, response regulator NreC